MAATTTVDNNASALDLPILQRKPRSLWSDAWRRLKRNRAAMLGFGIIFFFIFMAFFAPLLAPHNPLAQTSNNTFRPPAWAAPANGMEGTWVHPLGTDQLGRDLLSRLIYGARISMIVGFVPLIMYLLVGVTLGLVSGYRGGWVDNLLMRFTDITYSFPDLLFFIIVMSALRETWIGKLLGGLILLFVALAAVNWVGYARLVRGQVLSLKQKEFVEAARMVGASSPHIMFRHLLPNTLGPIIISSAFTIPGAILAEAGLSFLGIGIRPATDPGAPFPTSWGSMINEGFASINAQPWSMIAPGICIALVMLAFTFVGDGLRDALDPRLQE
jgi:oligopeptide transport system permease protein